MDELKKLLTLSDKVSRWFILWSVIFVFGAYAIIGKDIIVKPLPENVGYMLLVYALFLFFHPIYKWVKGNKGK